MKKCKVFRSQKMQKLRIPVQGKFAYMCTYIMIQQFAVLPRSEFQFSYSKVKNNYHFKIKVISKGTYKYLNKIEEVHILALS